MKILITGANGFVGKNLIAQLNNIKSGKAKNYSLTPNLEIVEFDIDSDFSVLDNACKDCDFVLHLAGVNRPKEVSEFMEGNFGFTSTLLDTLKKYNNDCPIMISSSTQALLDNPYGESKRAGEDLIREFFSNEVRGMSNEKPLTPHSSLLDKPSTLNSKRPPLIYRFPNIFGKWCRPNYNSAVATFCHNIANDLPIQINDRNAEMTLVYIDDVVDELIRALDGKENRVGDFCEVKVVHKIRLGEIVDKLYFFKDMKDKLSRVFW